MLIIIDLSKKLFGFNLFESFFYTLKKDGILMFANNSLDVNDDRINYDEVRRNIQNILYEHHVNSWSLCVLYDLDKQEEDPLKYSIATNIHCIKENIIKPLSRDYIFNKFYYLSLDTVYRNCDCVPTNDNINIGINFDSKGYVTNEINSIYSKILFFDEEFKEIDKLWSAMKNKSLLVNKFKERLSLFFETKIDVIKENFSFLSWYGDKLNKVHCFLLNDFENIFINSIEKPTVILKKILKMEVSTYSENDVIILHIDLNDKNTSFNYEVLRYRHQLEIVAIIICLAVTDTNLIFEENRLIGKENHWKITAAINEKNLYKMLSSYNLKLKTEIAKLGNFISNEIEYKEFSPRTFNFAMEMKKTELPLIPRYNFFSTKRDSLKIESFVENLYNCYLESIELANKRVVQLSLKLRTQKESGSLGRIKKSTILELNSEIIKRQKQIKELQQKIVFYKPKEILIQSQDYKLKCDAFEKEIKGLVNNQIEISMFIKNLFLVIIISLCMYLLLQVICLNTISKIILLVFMIIVPALIYTILQLKYSNDLKNNITKEIDELIEYNEKMVNSLFVNDNEIALYIQDMYNLIMLKKYVNECDLIVARYNKKFKLFNYHYNKLKEHVEISNKLIKILNLENIVAEIVQIEKIKGLDLESDLIQNVLYCPLSYLLMEDSIKTKVVINDQKIIEINNKIFGFVDKIIVTYDKEYNHD